MSDWLLKDPEEKLNYTIQWADWLGEDTISESSWAADTGLTVESDSNTDVATTVVVSGGTIGHRYLVTNTITTAGGLIGQRSIVIQVAQK